MCDRANHYHGSMAHVHTTTVCATLRKYLMHLHTGLAGARSLGLAGLVGRHDPCALKCWSQPLFMVMCECVFFVCCTPSPLYKVCTCANKCARGTQ